MKPINLATSAEAEEVPSALEIAAARSKLDLATLTTAAFNHLRGGRIPLPPEAMPTGRVLVLPKPDETARAICFDICFELAEQELAGLKEVQAFMDASLAASQPWALSNVSKIAIAQRDLIAEKMTAGQSTEGLTVQSREEISRVCLTHLNAADAARRRMTVDTLLPLCKPILERFWAALEQQMKSIEETDRAICLAFSLTYEPSLHWRAYLQVASIYKPSSRLGITSTWSTPASILGGLFQ